MASEKVNSIIILLLSINFALGDDPLYQSAFTKEIRLPKYTEPHKANNKLLFSDGHTITSIEPGAREYILSTVNIEIWPKSILSLGKGKLLITDNSPAYFFLLYEQDFHNDIFTLIHYDKDVNANTEITTVIAYNDTFDIFDRHQEICMPCRYNDKGERQPVEHTLKKEPNDYGKYDRDTRHYNHRYSLELVKNGFGVQNGYIYVYTYFNYTTALRILDSEFKIVKQRLFPIFERYSLTGENLTVCYTRNIYEYGQGRHYIECHLLNTDLKTVVDVKLHEIKNVGITELIVQNLPGGGAMVGMVFTDRSLRTSVYVQKIHPDGRVDPPIQYNSEDENLVQMKDFMFDNGEYCLVTVNREENDPYTLVKCSKP